MPSRRRQNLIYTSSSSSDDEENDNFNPPQQPQHSEPNDIVLEDAFFDDQDIENPSEDPIPNLSSVTLNPTSTNAAAVEISDEEYIDVSENLSPPERVAVATPFVASDCPVNDQLRKLGLGLRREWLSSCLLGLGGSVPGFGGLDVESRAKLCFGQFLSADMNLVGGGVLPHNVSGLHLVHLPGPFVLQVDEVVNISCPLRERYKNAAPGLKRCLKLSMTDGVQRVIGMEYRPIRSLETLAPAGFKVVIHNVHVRRGLLMLVPEVLEVLGGSVEDLEAARQRLVSEVNKPPRGKRTRTGVVPPLSTRATHAAWPENGVVHDRVPQTGANRVPTNITNSAIHASSQLNGNMQGGDTLTASRSGQAIPAGREPRELQNMGGTVRHSMSRGSGQHSISRETVQHSFNRETSQYSFSRDTPRDSFSREAAQQSNFRETAILSSNLEAHEIAVSREAIEVPPNRESTALESVSTTVIENEDAHMVDYVDHPFILSREKELPFTYLASLTAKWNAVQYKEPFVQGKIKCFLTGVKQFQYKHQSTFELLAYVEDGSLISEILIHHDVVQNRIGYTPAEVTAALLSTDMSIVTDMKNILFQFQGFLTYFEGTMLVEMNKTSTLPVAIEMNQGCPASDAWPLFQRLKPVTSSASSQNNPSSVITLSP